MTGGELLGGLVVLAILGSLLMSVRVPRARIAAGLLLLGLALAYGAVGIWRLAEDRHVYVVRWLLFIATVSAAGVLLFRWGRRTSGA